MSRALWNPWRGGCWEIIKERQDLQFVFLTKRTERFNKCIPNDWGDGYENVTVGYTIENIFIEQHLMNPLTNYYEKPETGKDCHKATVRMDKLMHTLSLAEKS